jgi:uncharacterized membrane protein
MDQTLWKISVASSVVGLLDSLYLSWSKLAHTAVFCGGSGQCETVQSSSYAEFAGIPIAILGVIAYLVILGIHYLETRGNFWSENGPVLLFGLGLIGFLYSAFLTYIELAVLHAICPYCVISAVAITIIFLVSIVRLVQTQPESKPTKRFIGG